MTDRHSYSELQTYKACPLRYYLGRVIGLEVRGDGSEAHHIEYGKAMHEGLQAIYSGRILLQAQAAFSAAYPEQLQPLDRAKTRENGTIALERYVLHWRNTDAQFTVLSCEELDAGPFASGLDTVRLDLVIQAADGQIYGVDHKVTGKDLTYAYWAKYDPNSQITHYIDYIQERYGSCAGFFINAISMTWREPVKSNGASNAALFEVDDAAQPWLTYSHHEERFIKGNKQRKMIAAWGLITKFERVMFNRSSEQITQERASTALWIQAINQSEQLNRWAFNTESCYSCEFRGGDQHGGICRHGYEWPRDEELILMSYRIACRKIIQVQCVQCDGRGIVPEILRDMISWLRGLTWNTWNDYESKSKRRIETLLHLSPCASCAGSGAVNGSRCRLDLDHEEPCCEQAPTQAMDDGMQIEVASDMETIS